PARPRAAARGGAVDPALLVRLGGRAERAAPGDPLAGGLRRRDRRRLRLDPRRLDARERAAAPAALRHRLLVALLAGRRRGAARVPHVRDPAPEQARRAPPTGA